MEKTIYKITIEFITDVLGSQPQRNIVTEYINPNLEDDEYETLPEKLEKATTAFHKVDGQPVFFDYQIKGFLKEAAKVCNGLKLLEVKALRSKVTDHLFVYPRIIPLQIPEDEEITWLERPLRAETAQGPRVALARSEQLPKGTKFDMELHVLDGSPLDEDILRLLLSYGEDKGIGQWRNGGHGRFTFILHKA